MGKKQIVIKSDDSRDEVDVKYNNGDERKTTALIILVDHDPAMSFITHGNAQKIARLIFGAYRIALERASGGSLQDAWFVEMLEKVCEDIATLAGHRKSKIGPEELMERLRDLEDKVSGPDRGRKHH
ncbi:MAG: hypothetical protein GTN70_01000 [Deltaproteobacteria bacterium]|nr:hypothetical protein [Deltaproteobacteria bacterium]NIS76230.1 hypothetical protein [Deltaproteobacteria bacterium]